MTLVVDVGLVPIRADKAIWEDELAFSAENLTQALGWIGARIGRGATPARYEVTIDLRDE